MEPFIKISGRLAPIELNNVDTDMIIPKEYLKTIKRTGLGINLFAEMRYDKDGEEITDFILNKAAYRESKILVAGDNFGCGSSREHAPWSLRDFGIRSIIATSFADIFYNNCFKNSILPIILAEDQVAEIMQYAYNESNEITVDLPNQKINCAGKEYNFTIDSFRKKCLLEGLDDIGLTLKQEESITAFEQKQKNKAEWLYQDKKTQ